MSVGIDTDFLDLMIHRADFQQMSRTSVSADSYGHQTPSRVTVAATTADVRCRLRSLTTNEMDETQYAGQAVADYMLDVPYGYLPTLLTDQKNAALFQVVNVRAQNGVVVEDGPLQIDGPPRLMAGEQHHYLLRVRKIN